MASYASNVKKELTSLPIHPEHAKAELAAFLRMNGVLNFHEHQFSLDITSRYHLEIYSIYQDHNDDLLKIMNDRFNLNAKSTKRRRGYIVYLKEAEKIGDFLHIVGALNAMLSFEDLRIMRDMRNSVNRLVNCDTANLKKTANAAAKQVEDIELIERKIGLENIPEKLQGLARLRLEEPELSLKEIAQQVPDGPISKSGVNHRFKKIHDIAENIKK